MKITYFISCLFLCAVLMSCKSTKPVKTETPTSSFDIQFDHAGNFSEALTRSATSGKPVFVDFYASWCLPCKLMEEEVFSDQEISEFFNENFINVKIDGESEDGSLLVLQYLVTGYPTLLFLNGQGEILVRKEGAAFHRELRNLGEEALYISNKN